jgi:hypothetical protein
MSDEKSPDDGLLDPEKLDEVAGGIAAFNTEVHEGVEIAPTTIETCAASCLTTMNH